MRLTDLAIEGYTVSQNLLMSRFNPGLNIVFGEPGSGKSTIRQFVRGVFYGFGFSPGNPASRWLTPGDRLLVAEGRYSGSATSGRYLDMFSDDQHFRAFRDPDNNAVRFTPLEGHLSTVSGAPINLPVSSVPHDLSQLTSRLPADLYDALFNIQFSQTDHRESVLSHALTNHLDVEIAAGEKQRQAYALWQQETELLSSQVNSLQSDLEGLSIRRADCERQLEQSRALRNEQLESIERRIRELVPAIEQIRAQPVEDEIATVVSEIARIRQLIDNASQVVEYVPPATPAVTVSVNTFASLYQRLDEIENQIRRWRRVQNDIQQQRIRLRDEMVAWNELTLDSDKHPYHTAREILVALESKVERARDYGLNPPGSVDSATTFSAICDQMRDDIYGLCAELSQQYKHIRHKAAAAELKQLRRCYNEMGENIKRLVQRRQSILNEIREKDPAGADLILRADDEFCKCAKHEGYLEARRRFVGNLPVSATSVIPPVPQYRTVTADTTVHRNRLADLESRLAELRASLSAIQSRLSELRSQHSELVARRDALIARVDDANLLRQIEVLDADIIGKRQQLEQLKATLASTTYVAPPVDPVLERASVLLRRLSHGELVGVRLDASSSEVVAGRMIAGIVAEDRFGNGVAFESLGRGQQDLTYLSLAIAGIERLRRRGTAAPVMLDDVFVNLDRRTIDVAFDVLREISLAGSQVFVFARRTSAQWPLGEGVSAHDVTTFELPQTTVSPAPFSNPGRHTFQPDMPRAPDVPGIDPLGYASSPGPYVRALPGVSDPVVPPYPVSKYDVRERAVQSMSEIGATFAPAPVVKHDVVTPVVTQPVDPAISETASLVVIGIFDDELINALNSSGIYTIADLLDADPRTLHASLSQFGVSTDQFDRWQAQTWLMVCVPGLTAEEAGLLVACGVTEPEHIDTTHSNQLYERIQRFLATPDSRRFVSSSRSLTTDRVARWYSSLDSTRSRWRSEGGYSRRNRYRSSREPHSYEQSGNENSPRERSSDRDRTQRSASSVDRAPRAYEKRERTPRQPRERRSRSSRERELATPMVQNFNRRQSGRKAAAASSPRKLKFYLELTDHIEAAPSIGPKTAERFEKIGVVTIDDFLRQNAESMAGKIDYKRINAPSVLAWQQQARLVCRVPNLRGHDAQLLVACGISDPESLSAMSPAALFDIIDPFSETKEGLKIIRSGKRPDLEEVTDWITWAQDMRPLKAA
ncbi:MAG: DUF4332 domain-containing protein [Planctomycetota bacterium]